VPLATIDPDHERAGTIPVVVQLTDDNGDGRVDAADGNDVAFLMSPRGGGGFTANLVVLDGETGSQVLLVPGRFLADCLSVCGAMIAAADADGDGVAELLVSDGTEVLAYGGDGTVRRRATWPAHDYLEAAGLAVADLDQDGTVEVANRAFVTSFGPGPTWIDPAASTRNVGNALAVVADVDPSVPGLEVFAGNALYSAVGDVLWRASLAAGPAVVADLDGDDQPEILLVSAGQAHLFDPAGRALATPLALGSPESRNTGMPVVAGVDGDGALEAVIPATTVLRCHQWDGMAWHEEWLTPIDDFSGAAGATAFDFDGDGASEVVFRDENEWLVIDGACGSILYREYFPSRPASRCPWWPTSTPILTPRSS
jgi:hypothetical protein